MKGLYSSIVIVIMISVVLISCMEKEKKTSTDPENVSNSASTIIGDMYQPGKDYDLAWSDEFEGDTINSNNWNLQVVKAGRFNDEWQRYTNSEENAYLENGSLVIKAIHESNTHGMDQYTSARVNTANKQSWKYGKIVARVKLPQGNGMWPAFWMLGANINENGGDTPWPQCGEIDIFELYGSKEDGAIEANMHYANKFGSHGNMGAVTYKLDEGKFADDFHIFELEWDSKRLTWYVDGNKFASAKITKDELSEFHKEFFILFNVAVGGAHAGRPNSSTNFPQHMYVDWVRVYQKI